ncbi:hypothetical protein H0H93_008173 [Arthromyces matolae]|nr:hypothetical protein H0H93_008173 [Arthromyces matolae]
MGEYNWVIQSKKEPPDPKYLEAVRFGGLKRDRDNDTNQTDVFGPVQPTTAPKTPSGRARKKRVVEESSSSETEMENEEDNLAKADGDKQEKEKEKEKERKAKKPATERMGEERVAKMLEDIVNVLPQYSDHTNWSQHTTQLVWAIAHKFQLLVPANENNTNADSDNRDQKISEIAKALGSLTEEFKTLRSKIEERPKPTAEESKTSSEASSKTRTVHATGPTYRPIPQTPKTSSTTNASHSPYHTSLPKNPMQSYHPSRLVIIPRGCEIDQKRLHPKAIVDNINDALASRESSQHLRVVSAHYNQRRNLIIMSREDQTGADLLKHADAFIHVFDVPENALEITTDDRRYKVRIDGVWTGEQGTVLEPEELAEELVQKNPIMAKVKLISNPKWIRSPEDIKTQERSSIVLEFGTEDEATLVLEHNVKTAGHSATTPRGAAATPDAEYARGPIMRTTTPTSTWTQMERYDLHDVETAKAIIRPRTDDAPRGSDWLELQENERYKKRRTAEARRGKEEGERPTTTERPTKARTRTTDSPRSRVAGEPREQTRRPHRLRPKARKYRMSPLLYDYTAHTNYTTKRESQQAGLPHSAQHFYRSF